LVNRCDRGSLRQGHSEKEDGKSDSDSVSLHDWIIFDSRIGGVFPDFQSSSGWESPGSWGRGNERPRSSSRRKELVGLHEFDRSELSHVAHLGSQVVIRNGSRLGDDVHGFESNVRVGRFFGPRDVATPQCGSRGYQSDFHKGGFCHGLMLVQL
jgi:hypothetical protein